MVKKKRRKISTRAKANLRRKGRKPAARAKTISEIFDGSARKIGRTARKLTNKAISKIRSIKFL